ncbi:energy-coupling factor transporter ATP-binding protein EcfA2 [Bradyrhizobium japonicum]|uniref:AAA family ATPase n=1 Tax=Bradyrhizobium barranii subsp. barranii TaxID=2823807 RepID=A0A939MHI6_9BRAD|nr:AAA family ATPase [Bradyrhizobium diazoefficiens]MBR0947475.1 AAA family ATPase [Bradyrhizobium liaoningense]MBR0892700.1 AAA family ATPase [Bradyrhizobium diazoefficiens]MBR0924141.1 AAA family ATPase [Bradyrhizobium diazoefficiens]MBR1004150.1 AAA family ATPase [Bradyrhizobium liaoningense]
MAIIENIRLLKGAAVLAERKATTPSLDLKRYNLFYGFNGSGKSTLSRILAALQHGKKQERLPEGCTFEIELSSGAKFTYPKALSGLVRLCFQRRFHRREPPLGSWRGEPCLLYWRRPSRGSGAVESARNYPTSGENEARRRGQAAQGTREGVHRVQEGSRANGLRAFTPAHSIRGTAVCSRR